MKKKKNIFSGLYALAGYLKPQNMLGNIFFFLKAIFHIYYRDTIQKVSVPTLQLNILCRDPINMHIAH